MSPKPELVPNEDLLSLAFDQFSRQYQAKRLVEAVRDKAKLKILDVGGNNGKTREFFPDDDVHVVDLYDVEADWYTKASALDLPFNDESFDVVTCFDVYEHISKADRIKFMSELTRVSSSIVLIAAPFNTPYVDDAEQRLNNFYKEIKGSSHQWLQEHIDNGLPEIAEVEAFFNSKSIPISTYSSNNVALWSSLQSLIFLADAAGAPEFLIDVNRFYNANLSRIGDTDEPSYRRIFFASKQLPLPVIGDVTEKTELAIQLELVNLTAKALYNLVHEAEPARVNNAIIKEQKHYLQEKDNQIEVLKAKLDDILNSRSYKLASSLKKAKNAVIPKRSK